MSAFKLDTSGAVHAPDYPPPNGVEHWHWHYLHAFTQGYVEAVFQALWDKYPLVRQQGPKPRFDWLAPETLTAILEDCANFVALGHWVVFYKNAGADFWRDRNGRQLTIAGNRRFPPLTATLGDDGKVYLREGSAHV